MAYDVSSNGPTLSGPTLSGPTLSGPTLSGPTLSGPTLSGPMLSKPTLSGPTLSRPTLSGPTLSGPSLSGPTLSGPTLTGPTPYRTGVKYVYGSFLSHNDTYITFVADAECMNAVPVEKEQCSVHSTEYSVLRALHTYTLHMYTFITRNWQIATLVKRKTTLSTLPEFSMLTA
jgi:hypothetical protein